MAANVNIEQHADGSIIVDIATRRPSPKKRASGFDANLADGYLDDQTLSIISSDLLRGIEADVSSRTDFVQNYNDGLKLLGVLMEKGSNDSKTSKVRHPMLMWAIVRFQAQTAGEMLPVGGPCKVENDGEDQDPKIAEALERDLNHYIKAVATEYYPDTDRGLFYLAYGGTIFKKVYWCPLRDRAVSECVYLPDLIISNDTTDIPNAARVTHRVQMSEQQILQLQDKGYFADVTIHSPSPNPTSTQTAMGQTIGVQASPTLPEDFQHNLYECYTNLDLGRFSDEYRESRQSPGIALPYRVTIDKDSRQVYEVRRSWREEDERRLARRRFFKWGLVPGIGYLDLGYLNLLGNHTMAGTALLRILVDAGIYSIWPGGVRVKGMRMETNEIRPGPGEFPEIDTSGLPIAQAIMPMPFKGPAAEVLALLQHLEGQAEKTAGQIEVPTGSGLANIPVGTIMASIDQQAQIDIALHRRLHNAQKEELRAIRDLLLENGERGMALLKQGDEDQPYTAEQLGSASLIPASDPNTPARVHRVMQATVLEALATSHPEIYNVREVQKRILDIAKVPAVDEILIPLPDPNAPPPLDPTMAIAHLQAQIERERMKMDDAHEKAKLGIAQMTAQLKSQMEMQKMQGQGQLKVMEIQAKGQQAAQAEQIKAQMLPMEMQAKAQADQIKAQADAQTKAQMAQTDMMIKSQESQAKMQADAQEAQVRLQEAQQQAMIEAEVQAQQSQAEMENAEADRLSRERIAAMANQTDLIKAGVEQLGEQTSPDPARDDRAGP